MKRFYKDLRKHAMTMIDYDKKRYNTTKKAFATDVLNGVALNENYYKVRDHCHYIGKFRGAAYSICNLRYKNTKRNPNSIS